MSNFYRYSLSFALLVALSACGDDAAEDGPTGGAAADLSGMPCEVQATVTKYCGTCHGDAPIAGAPMSLTSQTSFHANALNGTPMHQRVLERLNDPNVPMPPVNQPQLSEGEKQALTAWLNAKAPTSSEACEPPAADAGTGPAIAPPINVVPDSECDTIIELRAHGGQTAADTSGYAVPQMDDHYECFYFEVPWTEKMQVLRIEPLIGDPRTLHHFLLYQEPKQVEPNGTHNGCFGAHPDSSLLAGWAPGGQPTSLPPGVGLQVASGPTAQFNLEIHYNNQARHQAVSDNSGVRICATKRLRENEATAHWLGSEAILLPPGESTVQNSCFPRAESHIISVSPHMHRLGKHMSTIITRADGKQETLFDAPFDFNDQRIYPVGGAAGEVIVRSGDRLTTSCTWRNDTNNLVTFGEATQNEMCYNFVVAWPAGSLDTGGNLIQGPNRCMQ